MLTQGTKVLITGGAGFLGSHVARALSASGCEVRVLDDLSTGRRDRIAALDGIQFLHAAVRNPAAVHYPKLTFDKVLSDKLNVMDATAIVMCRDNHLPLRLFNLNNSGDLTRIVRGEDVGTTVTLE